MNLTIRSSKPNEINIVFDLLRKAAIWLKDKNIDYWQNWIKPPDVYIAWIKQGFDKGEFYFVCNNENIIVGMFRLQYSDEIFWGKRTDKAGYIHSFTTDRAFKGNGIGRFILEMVEKELAKEGFKYLRLDCSPEIKGLCKYYENYGFTPKEIIEVYNERLQLYEKIITK